MKNTLKRIRGALVMGLIWATVWFPLGLLIGQILDPNDSMDEPWVMVGALPGFIGGVIFSVVLGIAERRRRFDQLSLARFGAWGAVAGLLVGTLPLVLGSTRIPLWLWAVAITAPITVMSALSAVGSLAIARKAEKRELLDDNAGERGR